MAEDTSSTRSSTLADLLLETGKRAFDPSIDIDARRGALDEFQVLIDG